MQNSLCQRNTVHADTTYVRVLALHFINIIRQIINKRMLPARIPNACEIRLRLSTLARPIQDFTMDNNNIIDKR